MILCEFDSSRLGIINKAGFPIQEYDVVYIKINNTYRPLVMVKDIVNGTAKLESDVSSALKQQYDAQRTADKEFPKTSKIREYNVKGLENLISTSNGKYALGRMDADSLAKYKKLEDEEISNYDSQINEVLELAGVQLDEEEDLVQGEELEETEGAEETKDSKEEMTLEKAKAIVKQIEDEMHRQEYADDFYYTDGGYDTDLRTKRYYEDLIKELAKKEEK